MTTTFHAAVWRGDAQVSIEEATVDETLWDDAVQVRMTASNVSISDHLFVRPENLPGMGPMPQILGHGGTGIVERVGAGVTRVKPGDKVLLIGTPQCNECWYCLNGRADWCAKIEFVGSRAASQTAGGERLHASSAVGSFAEIAVLPEIQVVPVNTSVPDDLLSLLTIPYSTGLGAAMLIAPVKPGATVGVSGLGLTGLAYIQGAKLSGAKTIVGIDPIAERRAKALELGATHVVDPADGDVVAQVQELVEHRGGFLGAGVDFAFDASASTEGMLNAWAMSHPAADVVQCSVPLNMGAEITFPATPLSCQSRRMHGCQQGGMSILRDIPWAVDLIESGLIDPRPVMDLEIGLDDVASALDRIAAHEVLGVTVTFD